MKAINKILTIALGGLALAGCNDLDTEIQGGYATTEQKSELTEEYPEKLVASVAGITANFSKYMTVYSDHNDFGYPALMLALDSRGTDLVGVNTGYNWFSSPAMMSDARTTGFTPTIAWYYMYSQIYSANSLLQTTGNDSDDPETLFFIAQARAIRAFDYWVLAQLFQFNYQGHQNDPCVPLITDQNIDEIAAAGGAPRATVQQVYEQILDDLNFAVEALNVARMAKVTPSTVIDSKPKRFVSLAVAYGLRARVYLTMGMWNQAAEDAQDAITVFTTLEKGAVASQDEVSQPTFWSIDQSDWMWGIAINTTDRVVTSGIVNWPSHMGSLADNSYAGVGAWRKISQTLYDEIPSSDVRKGWFLSGKKKSNNLPDTWQDYCTAADMPAYTQVKFAPYQDQLGNQLKGQDIPLMRVEEMYLILAEAQAMGQGAAMGAQTLQSFVKTYRNKSYSCLATTPETVQEEVWLQRRIELWGEGISYFDIMRLNKGIDRVGGGWPADWTYKIPAGANVLRFPIPNGEIQSNPFISEADNNPSSETPTPVAN